MAPTAQTMQSSAASNSAQGPASSAPVLEFVCLFTHDLKRKQKRWQDGRLKFHVFNKRIMVYDERGNFIGDTHWREDYEFGDGDEVQLERGGVIVQAAECLGTHSQDLSELIDKRVHEKVQRQSAAAAARQQRSVPSRGMPVAPQTATPHFQLRHTPLHNLLGTPTGHHGRALAPTESPFEERRRLNAQQSPDQQEKSPHPAKRRRMEVSPPSKSGYAQSLFGTTLSLSGRPMSSAPVRHKPHHSQVHRREYIPPTSSDLSNQQDHDDQPPQVSQLVEPTTQSSLPLSENRTAANDIPKAPSDALTGKDARSKANVPPLLHRMRHPAVETAVEPVLPPAKAPRKVIRSSDQADQSDPPPTEQAMNKSTRKKKGADKPHNLDQLPQKPLDDRNRAKTAKDSESANNTAASTRLQAPTHESPNAQENPQTLQKDLNDPTISVLPVVEKRVAREPRIELRVAPSKKRGLLMLTEISKAKKPRKSGKSESRGDSGPSSVPQMEMINRGSTSGPITEASSSKNHSFNSATEEMLDGHARHNQRSSAAPKLATSDFSEVLSPVPGTDEIADTLVLDERRAQVTSNASLTQKRLREDEKIHLSFAHEPIEETVRQTRMKKKTETPRETPKQNLSHAYQEFAASTMNEPRSNVATTIGHPQINSNENPTPIPRNMIDYERDFDEILSKRPDNAPPPRLAQLSRKSVRSREIIGLFFDDDETPRVQPASNIRPNQRESSGSRQKPAPATGSFSKGDDLTNPVQADVEATQEILEPLAQPHQASSKGQADVIIHQMRPTKQPMKKTQPFPPEKYRSTDQPNQPSSVPPDILVGMNSGLSSKQMHTSPKPSAPPAVGRDNETHVVVQKPRDVSTEDTRTSTSNNEEKGAPRRCTSISEAPSVPGRGNPSRLGQKLPRSISDLSSHNHMPEGDVQKEDPVIGTAVTSRAPVPRIVNPATRGKKAAKPSDAAGQIPEIILPSDDRVTARAATKTAKESPSALPGFSKANGGAWSKEAYDLFEFRRPG